MEKLKKRKGDEKKINTKTLFKVGIYAKAEGLCKNICLSLRQFKSFSERIAGIKIDVSHKLHEANEEVEVSHPVHNNCICFH